MNTNYTRLLARFGPETRFEVEPAAPAPFRAVQDSRFEKLKHRLLNERLGQVWEPGDSSQLRRAANEAAALAWVTPYPLLVFPVLFEEKATAAADFNRHQRLVRQRSQALLSV